METDNFIIHHNLQKDYVQKAAGAVEEARARIANIFLLPGWKQKCHLYLYDTLDDFEKINKTNSKAYAFSECTRNGEKKIHLLLTPDAWTDKLPHEIAHCLLSDFGDKLLPRFIEEGMACYVETAKRRDEYNNFVYNSPEKVDLRQVIKLEDYPTSELMLYYCQSYLIVKNLLELKGRKVYREFLLDLQLSKDFEKSLDKVYGYKIEALQNRILARLR